MPLFGSSKKNPTDVVKNIKEALVTLEREDGNKKSEKASEELVKQVGNMKTILLGTADQEPQAEMVALLTQEVYDNNILLQLLSLLTRLDFETKKDVVLIFNNILRRQIGTRCPTMEYIAERPEILFSLLKGYESADVALNCGMMLRECFRHEALSKLVLHSEHFYDLFKYIDLPSFDASSDAFTTFKELLTRHKLLCADFFENNFDKFFSEYMKLLNSDNYVTKRQSLKLLGEILLERHNFNIMTKYINLPDNLKVMMNFLRDKSRNIQYEAFHVFKVFVANPNKGQAVHDILVRNKEKLTEFLSTFHTDRSDDEQFNDEKQYIIKQIKELE